MIDLTRFIRPGDGVWWSQTSAEPTPLVHALLDQVARIGSVRAFVGMSWDERLSSDPPEELQVLSYGALGALRKLSRSGRLEIVPCNYSGLPTMFARGELPHDVGFVQVSPPDADGYCTLGTGVDYIADAVEHTPVLIAEINRRMPATRGSVRIALDRFAATVETDRPLLTVPAARVTDVERTIASFVSDLIDDGDTLQIGVGALPDAVLEQLDGRADLGVHSGMITDGIVRLMRAGVITGARKEIDMGLVVAGAALGTGALYDSVSDLPIEFRAASYTHDPAVLSRLRSLVAVNSAIEVDLSGQVNSETRGGAYIGAVGGQADFSRAASLSGSLSIIALRARSGERSTIVASLAGGPVSTSRTDVDAVVTEFGVAHLRGQGFAERARRLTAIAAPEFRADLDRASGLAAALSA
ncbi:4-hydroxybutyrate CoA-transferase [Frondihabitans sp. PAMC 28766]|uniref:acetyl-CoA hydrolase/transferase family protein n=1 Tax=Frondihabitans sp. PAMC 28766 TaxID=1795630 RepID=UPI00078E2AC7|nr:acetyl-CoA hydrolase/transferase C-terminal domain-containing protein [Frondihabitans sp. PAMC 28766]AMM21854.1 4-hydroxybutyrate CoA-transferase [Frondihabitans sp. PAMC 28766]